MIRPLTICAALLAGSAAVAQTTTIQQDFEAAAKLDAGADKAAALAAWTRLEARASKNKRSRAIVLVRKSAALLTMGRKDEAVAAARAGLADLPETDETLRDDRFEAHFNLGRIARESLDYATAAGEFAKAEAEARTQVQRYTWLYGLVDTQTFIDIEAAGASLNRLDALALTLTLEPKTTARYRQLRALLLMNRGDFAGAQTDALAAVQLLGGLTDRIDHYDIAARSDVGLAALLAGKPAVAREYMARSGIGTFSNGSFDPGVQMRAPDCGGEAGLRPTDVAVIEFEIGDDGSVASAKPIYAAGGSKVALEFATVARGWSWTAEQLENIPPFFRHGARVEMRCSNAFNRPALTDYMLADFNDWLIKNGGSRIESANLESATSLSRNRAAVAAAESRPDQPVALIAALAQLSLNDVLSRDERGALSRRVLAFLQSRGAPPLASLLFDVQLQTASVAETTGSKHRRLIEALLATPDYQSSAEARSVLRLLLADQLNSGAKDQTRILLNQVAAEQALAANHPLRVGALIRLASLEQSAGDSTAAKSAFERSGLAANQCSVIDAPPKLLKASGRFPTEAAEWGFEGWTLVEFDIDAEGKVLNERPTLAYPPFVFSKAGAEAFAKARFSKSFCPDGGLGCGSNQSRVRFVMPG